MSRRDPYLSPADWEADVETRLLRERLPEEHIPTTRELEGGR